MRSREKSTFIDPFVSFLLSLSFPTHANQTRNLIIKFIFSEFARGPPITHSSNEREPNEKQELVLRVFMSFGTVIDIPLPFTIKISLQFFPCRLSSTCQGTLEIYYKMET